MVDQELAMSVAFDSVLEALLLHFEAAQVAFEAAVEHLVDPLKERFHSFVAVQTSEALDHLVAKCVAAAKVAPYFALNLRVERDRQDCDEELDGMTCIRRPFPYFDNPESFELVRNFHQESSGFEQGSGEEAQVFAGEAAVD